MLKYVVFAAAAVVNANGPVATNPYGNDVDAINAARAARLAEHKKASAAFAAAVTEGKRRRALKEKKIN